MSCIPCEGWFDLTAATWADYDSDGDMDILLAEIITLAQEILKVVHEFTQTQMVSSLLILLIHFLHHEPAEIVEVHFRGLI